MARLTCWPLPVIAFVLVSLYLLAHSQYPEATHSLHPQSWGVSLFMRPPPRSRLSLTLEANERRYHQAIKERKDEIRRVGEDRVAFPQPFTELYTLWDFFVPAFSCPFPVYRVGTMGDGGKYCCGIERAVRTNRPRKSNGRGCVVYSMGVERQSSFEQEILHMEESCEVFGFDFSVTEWGPELRADTAVNQRAHFFPYKIGGTDNHTAHPPEYSLSGIMEELGHEFIDVLKVDIEGSEWDALVALVKSFDGRPLPFGQLEIEIHVGYRSDWNSLGTVDKWWSMLEEAGLRPFWTELNLLDVNFLRRGPLVAEWSFMNIRGNHALVDDTMP
ncbi:Methyltranfer-dom domain-containing protein [Mycena kentingensis (nom. inval.)]|nr:Methyltranfer-dom domain-containing protein [Mycena kentingensis (nom. inval.)]